MSTDYDLQKAKNLLNQVQELLYEIINDKEKMDEYPTEYQRQMTNCFIYLLNKPLDSKS